MARLVLILVLLFSLPAFSQDLSQLTKEQRAQLEQDLTQAQQAYESGDFDSARIALEQVYKQLPDPDVLYRLALCYERLGQDHKAIDAYQRYLAARPLDPERQRIEGVIRALKERSKSTTAVMTLVLKPTDARVYIDDAERIEQPNERGERSIEVSQGEHTIRVVRDGYETEERVVQLTPDQTYNLIVALTPVESGRARSTLGWILAGSGVAAITTGAAFIGISLGMDRVLDASYDTRDTSTRPANYDQLEKRHNAFVIAGWSTIGAGALLSLGGAYLLLRSPERPVAVMPTVGRDGVGATVLLTF